MRKEFKAPASGWSKAHSQINSNHFYDRHASIQQPQVNVVVPDSVLKAYRFQASIPMLSSMPENASLEDLLQKLSRPRVVLDLACGIGRCSVWLARYYDWTKSKFYLYDSNGNARAFGINKPVGENFYNDLDATRAYCKVNGLKNAEIIDAQRVPLDQLGSSLTASVDMVYSFMAFGFHWPFNPALEAITPYVRRGGLAIFGTRGFDQGNGRGATSRKFTNIQLSRVDLANWIVHRDARERERMKSSVVVLERK